MNLKSNTFIRRVIAALMIVLFCVLVVFYVPALFERPENTAKCITEWYYIDENGKEAKASLPHKLSRNSKGYTEIYTDTPDDLTANSQLCFWTYYQSVEVYADDQLIYHFDNSNTGSFGKASSAKWNFVEITPKYAQSQRITIKTYSPYADVNLRLNEVMYGTMDDLHAWLESHYGILHFTEGAIACAGIIFIILNVISKTEKRYRSYQLYAGILLLIFAIYLATGTKTLPIYWMSDYMREFLCFVSLLTLAIPLTLYIRTKVARKPRMVTWCNVLVILEIICSIVLFVIHGLGIRDMHEIIFIGLGFLMINVITGIVFTIYYWIKERSRFIPLTFVSLLLIVSIFSFEYIQFYQLSTLPFDTGVLSHVGAILVALVESFIYLYYFRDASKKQAEVKEENKSLQIQMLTNQIKPHFILNTIGAIRNLIKDDPDRASDLLYDFSRYIRNNLEQRDYTKPIPFPEELDHISTYVSLEKARFGDSVNIVYDLETKDFWIPPLTIQPFVENAIKHGISSTTGGTVTIITRDLKERTLIEIRDDGIGFDIADVKKKMDEKKSVGMRSAIMRLEKEMNATVTLQSSTHSQKSGSCIKIELPKKKVTKNENNNR